MIRVLHVHSGNLFGGVERVLETVAGHVPSDAPMTSEFALCFTGRLTGELTRLGSTVHLLGPVRMRRPSEVLRARRLLRALLRERSYDVALVHSSWAQALFGSIISRARVPLVRWFHAPDAGPFWIESWANLTRPALALCNSQYTLINARPLLRGVTARINYPPARCPTTPTPADRASARRQLGVDADCAVIVMAARFERLKGHTMLVEALARIQAKAWQAWIIGGAQRADEDQYLADLKQLIAARGLRERIRLLGERDDVAELLRAADIYCQPNTGPEAFGLSFVEALASGLPVITTRLGAAPEIVDDSCGILTEPGSIDGLVAALDRLLMDSPVRARLAENGVKRSAQFCDLPRAFDQLAAALELARPIPPSSC